MQVIDNACNHFVWPDLIVTENSDEMLGVQLLCWGNIQLGCEPPDNFVEWLDEVSKITGAYTSTECLNKADEILYKRGKR